MFWFPLPKNLSSQSSFCHLFAFRQLTPGRDERHGFNAETNGRAIVELTARD
jgi:hypothetical protein